MKTEYSFPDRDDANSKVAYSKRSNRGGHYERETESHRKSEGQCNRKRIIFFSLITGVLIICLSSVPVGIYMVKQNNNEASRDNRGVWTDWGDWSSCDVSCGSGIETRTRTCQIETDSETNCEGESLMEQPCQQSTCIGVWTEWGDWSSCDVSCGSGIVTRTRTCQMQTDDQPNCEGESLMEQPCQQSTCIGVWTNWGDWSPCDISCGPGIETRTRTCLMPTDDQPNCAGASVMEQPCQRSPCLGVWTDWGDWSSCDVSCGSGIETRTRTCQIQTDSQPNCEGESVMKQPCKQSPCYGVWTEWGDWSSCDVSCGSGIVTRTRTCQMQTDDQPNCEGESVMEQLCQQSTCIGVWTNWDDWSPCDVSCGPGIETRTRTCQMPADDQPNCEGDSVMEQPCQQTKCIGVWTDWGDWGSCDVSCGSGVETRTRTCQMQTDDQPNCEGESVIEQPCQQSPCLGLWTEWGDWSSCNVSCGSGIETRTRTCQMQTDDQPNCEGESVMEQPCQQSPCIGVWTDWGGWSSCDVSCGSGIETRTRTCQMQTDSQPNCEGESVMEQPCQQSPCNDVPYWKNWEEWSLCDATCGEGKQTRYRSCVLPDSKGQCIGSSREIILCNMVDCQAYGLWSTWSAWGSCSQSCGGGIQTRTRDCQKQSTNDIDCIGKRSMRNTCNTLDCPDCTRSCDSGILNQACDACICDNTNITVRTVTTNGKPLIDVECYATTALYEMIALSNEGGFIMLDKICFYTELLFRKEGYQETKVTVTTPEADVRLHALEFPILTKRPVSKYRLVSGGVKFCCSARAAPAITYYEWFKDGKLIDEHINSNHTELKLLNLTTQATGKYKCRANSPIGSIMSDEAELIVKGNKDDFCQGTLEDNFISLPSDCIQQETNTNTFNIGTCRPKACRKDTTDNEASCSDAVYSCCRPSKYEPVDVQCSRYVLSVHKVVACSCSSCSLSTIRISGVATGKLSGTRLRYGRLSVNGVFNRYTGADGSFSIQIYSSPDSQSLALKFQDWFSNVFHDMVKVLEIPAASTDDIYLRILLIEKPTPFNISSGIKNVLYGRSNVTSGLFPEVTELIIPPDSFYYENGNKHTGNVSVIFTYLLSSDFNEIDTIPGVFQFIDPEGDTSLLETLGVFNLQFKDADNNELTVSDPIDVALTNGESTEDMESGERMKLWGLNEETGFWELLPVIQARRRKRRQSTIVLGQANAGNYYWRNCDIYSRARTCYFSPLLYTSPDKNQKIESATLHLTYLYIRGFSARWTKKSFTTNEECIKIYCSGDSSFLHLEISTSTGKSFLIPDNPDNPSAFTVTEDRRAVQIRMQEDNINFFESNSLCKTRSTSINNILSFYQSETNENVFTFNWFSNNLPSPQNLDPIAVATLDWKSWCRPFQVTYSGISTKACAVRIEVQNPASKSIKVNVISKMGNAKGQISMDVIGVREVTPDSDGFACIPYRCNTDIDDVSDNTNLHLYIQNTTQARCSVLSVNSNIDNYEINNSELRFTVTNDNLPEAGLYIKEHQRFVDIKEDCKDLQPIVKEYCATGSDILATFKCV